MCVEMKMIVKNDTNISSIDRGVDGLFSLGRCLAEITSSSVLPLFSLRRVTRHPVINLMYTIISVKMITYVEFLNNVGKR